MKELIKYRFKKVNLEIPAGSTIGEVIDFALEFHETHKCSVTFNFNSITITVNDFYKDKEFLLKYFYYSIAPDGRD